MSAVPSPKLNPAPATARSLDTFFSELETQRRRAVRLCWLTALTLALTLPLAALPLMLLPTLGMETESLAPGSALRQLQPWLLEHDRVFGVVLFTIPVLWIASAIIGWRRFVIWPRNEYLWEHKRRILSAVCATHFPGMAYQPDGGMPWKLLDDSGLYPFACDVYRSEDCFTGHSGATDIGFSEAHAQRERKRGWGEDRETVYETYFRGIVFSADFHKHFHSTTMLVPKGADCRRFHNEDRVQFENPAFQDTFDTWTTDQVDARYVLSPGMLERFTNMNRRFPGLRARFHQDRLLLLLPSSRDRFEPSLYRRADDRVQLDDFVADVRACLAIVDELNLNTRVWSKG